MISINLYINRILQKQNCRLYLQYNLRPWSFSKGPDLGVVAPYSCWGRSGAVDIDFQCYVDQNFLLALFFSYS